MSDNPYESPKSAGQPPDVVTASVVGEGDGISVLIPYKNQSALIAYYSGVFSLAACIPLIGILGVVLAVVAVVAGRRGLRYAHEHPEARGRVHCWIGIIAGAIFAVLGTLMQVMSIIGLVAAIMEGK